MKKLLKYLRTKWHSDLTEKINILSERFDLFLKKAEEPGNNDLNSEKRAFGLTQWGGYDSLNKIYTCLCDDISKELFAGRLQYSLTGKVEYFYQMLIKMENLKANDILSLFQSNMYGNQKDSIFLYGNKDFYIAHDIIKAANHLGIQISGICGENIDTDNDMPVIEESQLIEKYLNAKIIIYAHDCWTRKDYAYLVNKGFKSENLFILVDVPGIAPQYFDKNIVVPREHEIFIDGGAYDMQTSIEFVKWCNCQYDAIYAFEPEFSCYQKSKNVISKSEPLKKRVSIFNAGLWSEKTQLHSVGNDTQGSRITGDGDTIINVESIDGILNGTQATFIKMDVEGAELEALKGAQNTIRKWRPKLAISLYHKPEDIIELPLYILSLVPDYKLYIRHYSNYVFETVLYCI
ncbi:hypothetical protein FACS1894190_05290 [Spirochaetia bacterium]|nr:hypothetical protein FACS1894190_05290 [Spirochaetia bacterium]